FLFFSCKRGIRRSRSAIDGGSACVSWIEHRCPPTESLIRSEPPRTVCRESGRCPSHGRPEVSPAVASSADCPTHAIPFLGRLFLGHAVLHATREVPDESEELAADCRDDLLLALPTRGQLPVAAMQ